MMTVMKRSRLLAWTILAIALTATLSVAVIGTTGILEPAYVSLDLRNVEDVPAICAEPTESKTITGRLVIDLGRRLPAHLDDVDGPSFIFWPRGFRVLSDRLMDDHGEQVARVGANLSIEGLLVDGAGTEDSPILLTFARIGSGCYVFVGRWPIIIGSPA